jgi:predicted alpha/beta-hydrolase family hydrolase
VAGKKVATAPKTLDVGWRGIWPAVAGPGLPVVSGGRSAGARVACRTAVELGAAAVLALSFPLHPPGRPEKSRADELLGSGVPTLVVQGGNDPFGKPEEFPDGAHELVEVPYGDHGFAVPKKADLTQEQAVTIITDAVVKWVGSLG